MPEGPEIFRMQQRLRALEGQHISVTVTRTHKNLLPMIEAEKYRNERVNEVLRVGKRIGIVLDSGTVFSCSAGMTGHWRKQRIGGTVTEHDLVLLTPKTGHDEFIFSDPRRFGSFKRSDAKWADGLGIDFTNKELLDAEALLRKMFSKFKRKPIKAALLDQSVIAGIGNVYASELCWHLRVHPERSVTEFDRFRALGVGTYQMLNRACRGKGVRDGRKTMKYEARPVTPGGYVVEVYDQTGNPCRRCGTAIEGFDLAGRSTYFCPTCQEA